MKLFELKRLKVSEKLAIKILEEIEIIPVFTAHPTEATRQTILKKILRITNLLIEKEIGLHNTIEHDSFTRKLKTEITLLWQSNEIRFSKITIKDEVMRGLFFFSNSIYKVLPEFYNSLQKSFSENLNTKSEIQNPIFKFGSWIGSDRDGHPFVTEEVSKETFNIHKSEIIKLYLNELNKIYDRLSISEKVKSVNPVLISSVEKDRKLLKVSITDNKFREPTETYRAKLYLIYKKLENSIEGKDVCYKNPNEFLSDIQLIANSLLENQGELIYEDMIKPLIIRVKNIRIPFCKVGYKTKLCFNPTSCF